MTKTIMSFVICFAVFMILAGGANAANSFASSRESFTLASVAAGLPPIQKEDRTKGLPPPEREISKPPQLEKKPLRTPEHKFPKSKGLSPTEDHRPGLSPPPALTPIIKHEEDHRPGLPPKN